MVRSILVALTIGATVAACLGQPRASTPESTPLSSAGTEATPTSEPAMTFPASIADVEKFAPLTPGTYFIDPDLDPGTPLLVEYTVPGPGWLQWTGAIKGDPQPGGGGVEVGLSIIEVRNLLVDGCTDHSARIPPIGPSVDDLATALTTFPPFEVVVQPRDILLGGHAGRYVELEVPDLQSSNANPFGMCEGGKLRGWLASGQVLPFYGYEAPGQREGFWILDVEATRLVIATTWVEDARSSALDELQEVVDSIVVRA